MLRAFLSSTIPALKGKTGGEVTTQKVVGKERFLLFTRTTPRAKNSSEKARAAPPRL